MKETSKGAFETQSGPQPDVTTVTDRLHSYEAITSTLQSIAVTGGRWAEDDHFAMWERAIQQLTAMPVRRGYDILWELRAYPGKLLLYSLGLGAVDSGRLEFLNRLFKTKVRIENSEEITAAAFLANFCSITKQRVWQDHLEGMKGRHVPFSDWLHEALRQPAQHIYLSEVEYTLQFDKFENIVGSCLRTSSESRMVVPDRSICAPAGERRTHHSRNQGLAHKFGIQVSNGSKWALRRYTRRMPVVNTELRGFHSRLPRTLGNILVISLGCV